MSIDDAKLLLLPHARKHIKTIYDDADLQQALLTIGQGMEYPDWSFRTVRAFLDHYLIHN